LSYEVWKADFAGEQDVVDKIVHLGGTPYTVIGVMPPEFRFPLSAPNVIYTRCILSRYGKRIVALTG
jgi:hypothetical protein